MCQVIPCNHTETVHYMVTYSTDTLSVEFLFYWTCQPILLDWASTTITCNNRNKCTDKQVPLLSCLKGSIEEQIIQGSKEFQYFYCVWQYINSNITINKHCTSTNVYLQTPMIKIYMWQTTLRICMKLEPSILPKYHNCCSH